MVELDKYLPVNREEAFRNGVNKNFAEIERGFSRRDSVMEYHQTTQNDAHNSKRIKHVSWDVDQELKYRAAQIANLVLGANGDGIEEVKDSRVAVFSKKSHATLSERLLEDFLYLHDYNSYYINIKSVGANGDGVSDNKILFKTLDKRQVYFVPKGTFKTTLLPDGLFFGYGVILFNDEIIRLDNKVPQAVNVDYNSTNKERYYNHTSGQDSGRNLTKESYANTAVGYATLRKSEAGRRLTAFGKGALSNIANGYSNEAFGADALGQGKLGQRNTGIGGNALKWGGTTDAISTLHDYWKDKGASNIINNYFKPIYPDIWSFLGNEDAPNLNLYPQKDDDFRENVAVGRNSLVHAMKSVGNVAVGYNSQAHTLVGDENTSIGNRSLRDNLLGSRNTALGSYASVNNISGTDNVAIGSNSLQQTLHATNNTAVGYGAMHFFQDDKNKNTEATSAYGTRNTAIGTQSMQDAKNASYSAFLGSYAGRRVEGNFNVGVGSASLYNAVKGENNTAVGGNSLREVVDGDNNVAVGYTAGPTGDYSNTVSLGANSHALGDNEVQLGSDDVTVYAHKEIQQRSDKRDKKDIRDTSLGLEFINKVRAVDYKYNNSNSNRYHHGFIAQELEALELQGYSFGGVSNPKYNGGEDVYNVGYSEIIAPLVKAVQELSAELEKLKEDRSDVDGD